jgi:hypothetical protein
MRHAALELCQVIPYLVHNLMQTRKDNGNITITAPN